MAEDSLRQILIDNNDNIIYLSDKNYIKSFLSKVIIFLILIGFMFIFLFLMYSNNINYIKSQTLINIYNQQINILTILIISIYTSVSILYLIKMFL